MKRIAGRYIAWRRTLAAGVFAAASILGAELIAVKPSIAAAQGCPVVAPPLELPAPGERSSLSADQASLRDGVAQARGDVRLTHKGQALEAPFVRYDRGTTQASARDGVKYYRPGLFITADNGQVNVDDETGVFYTTTYSVLSSGGRGAAATVSARGNGHYELTDANYSTCAGPTKAWLLSAQRIRLDRDTGRGTAYNTTLRLYDVPVLYTPYLSFPIDDKRHTGALPPTVGTSSDSGFELALPYYLNIAPNYDATLVPRILADRGLQLGGQFRYLFAHHRGEVDGQYLPHDRQFGQDRALIHYQHIGRFNRHVGIELNYTQVSDDDYFDDLSNDLADTATSQLEHTARLTFADPGVRFTLLAQDFQTLENNGDDALDQRFTQDPYARLPQARLQLLSPTAPFRAGLDAEFTQFQRDDGLQALRSRARPRLLWRVDRGGWFAESEAAYDLTRYLLRDLETSPRLGPNSIGDRPDDDSITRAIPSLRTEAGLRLARQTGSGWVQTLEPRAQYLYTGYDNQSEIPVFDSGAAGLRFDRLFADNRFLGHDRIGDANQLTLGLTSRLIDPASGRAVARFDLGRVTGFRDLEVRLPGGAETGYGERGSDYVAGLEINPSDAVRLRTTIQYDPDDTRVNRGLAAASYSLDNGARFDLGYRRYHDYRPRRELDDDANQVNLLPGDYEDLEQTVVGLSTPVTDRLTVVGRWNYSLEKSQSVETLAGLEYRPSCCWAGRFAWRRYVADDDGSSDTALMFQFVLDGLGRFGDTVQSFVNPNVFDDDRATGRRSHDTFDTIRSP